MKDTEKVGGEAPVAWHLEPVPTDGCAVCVALGRQREEARSARTRWSVEDCNEELLNHRNGQVTGPPGEHSGRDRPRRRGGGGL